MKKYTKKIGKFDLSTYRLSVKDALRLKMRLIKMFGPIILTVFQDNAKDLTSVLQQADTDEVMSLMDELISQCVDKDLGQLDFATHVNDPDEIGLMVPYQMAAWVLEVNFKDFFGEKGLQKMMAKLESMSP